MASRAAQSLIAKIMLTGLRRTDLRTVIWKNDIFNLIFFKHKV